MLETQDWTLGLYSGLSQSPPPLWGIRPALKRETGGWLPSPTGVHAGAVPPPHPHPSREAGPARKTRQLAKCRH